MDGANFSIEHKERIMDLLDRRSDLIVDRWQKAIKLNESDPFYEDIISNVKNSIRLMKIFFRKPNKELVSALTEKIAIERIEAKADLGHFIRNINAGRKIILDLIVDENFDQKTAYIGIVSINRFIDSYIYYAITHFTKMKDQIIREKTEFIQDMHSDRLSILGQISASFAHEFRNPLTAIKGFISLLAKNPELDAQSKYYVSIIDKEMDSLEDKVSQFLYLSKMKGLGDDIAVFDLTTLVKEMIHFMYPRFVVEAIKVENSIESDINVSGVVEQIKQVILNIMNNAVEELSEICGHREIIVNVHRIENAARVTIINNGRKIPSHILENIFHPFISTKELGTGLGLAVCKDIIEEHHGEIRVFSREDKTAFEFTLPIADVK
ncbi:signal transduction histidine kinase [Scopulibacillus darangshiensis]|uniref:histidine kinase n=1 Tax=Scopulibacillus darangshiensis TaxID=442528 RepID=A0A4R2P530_9BACL|nr:histidine kinase N-terminal domain-containing protein [Scopulibacillus darangshiensis]TCP29777.1 signal transduction histidine kinase [Scopulibacillus darangshiensis]